MDKIIRYKKNQIIAMPRIQILSNISCFSKLYFQLIFIIFFPKCHILAYFLYQSVENVGNELYLIFEMVFAMGLIYNISVMAGRDLQQEITNRINNESPTKYDIDFFKRKINRLENDCNGLQEDLNKARIRLRRAEDFELKYELILKQNTYLQNELDKKEKDLTQKKTELENLRATASEKTTVVEDWSKERLQLQREIEKWKVKTQEAEEKRIAFMLEGREKADLNQKRELQGLRKQFLEKEEGYQFQIRQLKKTLSEKENIEGVVQGRVEKVRNEKNQEIRRLQEFIEKQRIASDQAYKEKSEQLDKFRDKFQKIFNFQLQNLKKSVDDQDQLFSIELNGFKEMIAIKNDEIAKLLDRLRKESFEHQKEKEEQDRQIAMLREKIYTIQRQNQLEINNIKERLTKLHASDIEAIEKRYNSIVEGLKGDRKDFERQLKQKDKMVEGEKRQLQRLKHQMYDRLKERDTRIEHLQERIKETSEMNDNEIKNLHQSFHQIQSEKQLMTSEYQTNVGFLNQQLSKQTVKNQTLNLTIKGLHEEIVRIKKEYTELIQDIENRWKEERKQHDEQRQNQRQKIEKLQDEMRDRDRQYKIKEKHLERLRQKEQREKNKLQFIIQEMQRDAERLNNYIKQLDQSLKRELKKNQMMNLDTGGIRRELGAELDRQKAEIEVIKRLQIDQMRKKMEIQLTKLMNENEKLQSGLQQKTLALENLQQQFKKLEHINKNIDRINKQKLIQYEKKMAALNSEINVTQTLYQQFLETKARENRSGR